MDVKKVLYISYDGLTDPLGQSQILPYLKGLSKYGYQFTILSFEKKARFEKEANIIRAITKKEGITWVPLTFTAKPPVLSKIWDRYRMWQTALSLYKKNNYDLIHCRSYVAAEVGLKLKQKFGVKFLFDMRGFWADEKVDNGQWNLKIPFFNRLYKQYKKKEKDFLVNADGIVSLTQAAKDYLLALPTYKNLSINVIPCCADLDHFDYRKINKSEQQELKQKLGIKDSEKVITYLGSVGGWYMTNEMFLFFKQVQQTIGGYKMLILTKDDPLNVRAEVDSLGINTNDIVITYADRKNLPAYLSISTLSIFFIRNTFSKKASSPTKHAELMGMGVPVICNDIGDTGNIIEKTKTGFLVNTFDAEKFEVAITKIPQLEVLDKQLIRDCAIDLFDLKAGAKKYEMLYRQVLEY
ncbi:MAG TPA: glycosyltransferase [Chitinophagaceae bacterium]|nr:glycosyltransferase [Chitinophagaceae bacterium]